MALWILRDKHDTIRGGKTPKQSELGMYPVRPLPRKGDQIKRGDFLWEVVDEDTVPADHKPWHKGASVWASRGNLMSLKGRQWLGIMAEDLLLLIH